MPWLSESTIRSMPGLNMVPSWRTSLAPRAIRSPTRCLLWNVWLLPSRLTYSSSRVSRSIRFASSTSCWAGAAMATDVGQRVQLPVQVAGDQHALPGEFDDGAVAGLQSFGAGGDHPAAMEDPLAFELVHLVGEVVGSGECAGVVRHECAPLFPAGSLLQPAR